MRKMEDVTTRQCESCGAPLVRKRYGGTLEDRGVFLRRRFCDLRCSSKARTKPDELAGRSAINKRLARSRSGSCAACGSTENLSTHHVNRNWRDNRPQNLQTLCSSCHTSLHHRSGDISPRQEKKPCRVCGAVSARADLCGKHLQRQKKYGDPLLTRRNCNGSWLLVRQE